MKEEGSHILKILETKKLKRKTFLLGKKTYYKFITSKTDGASTCAGK